MARAGSSRHLGTTVDALSVATASRPAETEQSIPGLYARVVNTDLGIRLSVLDVVPVADSSTPADALRNSLDLLPSGPSLEG